MSALERGEVLASHTLVEQGDQQNGTPGNTLARVEPSLVFCGPRCRESGRPPCTRRDIRTGTKESFDDVFDVMK
jgi:hypothetical protein